MKTVAFVTFGCKVNQYETQGLRERVLGRGYREVDAADGADVYVINTCTVTQTAYKEAERVVRRLHRRFPSAEITITGCAADSNRADFEGLDGVRRVVTHDEKSALPLYLDDERLRADDLKPSIFDLSISGFEGHTRAFLKVQDGCDLHCSFCIIPRVRGANVSRDLDECVDEARRLVAHGYREIVVTGVHVGSFKELPELFRRLLDIPGLGRARLSSLEANEIHDDLLDVMAASGGRFCPHLHLPMQSGDDAVLRAMRRRYNRSQYLRGVERVRARVPGAAITTDVIVGFPGETDEQFENTVDLVRRCRMSRVHIFPYSHRAGTDASAMQDLPESVKKARLQRLEDVAAGLAREFAAGFVGREVDVLAEDGGKGYTERYVPARMDAPAGTLARARAIRAENGVLECVR
jgi:threonylcarbamoyladenosine tRNA methylthiotransferase MtaB